MTTTRARRYKRWLALPRTRLAAVTATLGEFQYLQVREYPASNSSLSTRDGRAFIPTQLRRTSRGARSAIKEANDEDHLPYGGAIARAVARIANDGSGANPQKRHSSADIRDRGREIAAPPWSAACMTDHGPSECVEPMWIYDRSDALARYRNAF